MPLTVRLDAETEHCLSDLLAETGQDMSSLIRRQLLNQRLTARRTDISPICIAEVLWLLGDPGDARVLAAQNDLLPEDDGCIAELNGRYADLPGDVAEILSLDSDFALYRRFRREPFCRVPCRAGRNR